MTTYKPATATVVAVERLSDSFMRVTFGGESLSQLGYEGPVLDQRIKLIFGAAKHAHPTEGWGDDWYQQWLRLPEEERGVMRTYSIRSQELTETESRFVVDFALHGTEGPATRWALHAEVGAEIGFVGPVRSATAGMQHDPVSLGIAFKPGRASEVVLVGDETAVPAIARTLDDIAAHCDAAARRDTREGNADAHAIRRLERSPLGSIRGGHVMIEVPHDADVEALAADITVPAGFEVHWLPRQGETRGKKTSDAIRSFLAHSADGVDRTEHAEHEELSHDFGTDGMIWEEPHRVVAHRYFWIAGESGLVRELRRTLVDTYGYSRAQVSFLGYWREDHGRTN